MGVARRRKVMNAAPRAGADPRVFPRHLSMTAAGQREPEDFGRLIEAVGARRDRAAFAALFAHFAPRLKTYMLRSGSDAAAAEDFAQEAMLAVWNKAALYDADRAGASAWIFTIARNLRIDAIRRQRRSEPRSDASQDPDPPEQPDAILLQFDDVERVRTALGILPEDQARVVHLSFFGDKAHSAIADDLGVPLGTVKSRLRLALSRLRKAMEDRA